jgi:hypothetical protein
MKIIEKINPAMIPILVARPSAPSIKLMELITKLIETIVKIPFIIAEAGINGIISWKLINSPDFIMKILLIQNCTRNFLVELKFKKSSAKPSIKIANSDIVKL